MSSVVHPVGKRPPRVYWIRRVVVLLLFLAVVAAVVVLGSLAVRFVSGLGGEDAAAATVPSESPTTPAGPDGPAACGPTDLELGLAADATSYPAEATPAFTLSVTNVGASSCTFDASAANREVVVTSGSDRIWSSADCRGETAEELLLLAAGAGSPTTVAWDRQRSAEGCPSDLPAPRPGTYQATATVAGVTLPPVAFTLN